MVKAWRFNTQKGWAKEVKARDGEVTKYVYGVIRKPDLHYWQEKEGFRR